MKRKRKEKKSWKCCSSLFVYKTHQFDKSISDLWIALCINALVQFFISFSVPRLMIWLCEHDTDCINCYHFFIVSLVPSYSLSLTYVDHRTRRNRYVYLNQTFVIALSHMSLRCFFFLFLICFDTMGTHILINSFPLRVQIVWFHATDSDRIAFRFSLLKFVNGYRRVNRIGEKKNKKKKEKK